MLAALGLSAPDELVYRALVQSSPRDLAALVAATGSTEADVVVSLTALVAAGLAVREDMETHPTWSAAPPAIALGALLRERRDQLDEAQLDVAALADLHRAGSLGRSASDVVEVITDVESVRHRVQQIQLGARQQVRSMMVPGLRVVPHMTNTAAETALRRGVRYRTILDRAALAEPGIVPIILASIDQGEQIRVADHVPVKLVVVDDTVAMLPLLASRNTDPESVLVHAGGVLAALLAYFDAAWESAYPLWPSAAGDDLVEMRPGEIDEIDSRVLALLLAGMTDQALAGQLGLSLRTVQRRIRQLMDKAGVETRLQLGWHAARVGWA